MNLVDPMGHDSNTPDKNAAQRAWDRTKGFIGEYVSEAVSEPTVNPLSPGFYPTLYRAATNPAQEGRRYVAAAEQLVLRYEVEGRGVQGALAVVQGLNPLHRSAVAAEKAQRAEEKGDDQTSGAERYKQLKGLVEFGVIVVGAAESLPAPEGAVDPLLDIPPDAPAATPAEEPASPTGGDPPAPDANFSPIPYGQTADSLGRTIGARAGEGARTASKVAKAAGKTGPAGPSWINRIINAVRKLKLSPGDSADVIESATTASSYEHGPRVTLPDGTIVVTSPQVGEDQFIIGVRTDGSIVRGRATIHPDLDSPGKVNLTDVDWN
jgi:hypothetical protein